MRSTLGSTGFRLAARIMVWPVVALCAWPATAAPARVGIAAFALWSDQGVFRSEATQAAAIVARRYGAVRTIVRANSAGHLAAGPEGLRAGIVAAGKGLDPATDVEIVILTSHGSPDGIAEQGGGVEGVLPPAAFGSILDAGPTRLKVLIVSACFSGRFTALAGPDVLVITAADADHPSFGCTATAKWTYFGQAFFADALRAAVTTHATLDAVFHEAASLVRSRETAEGFEPSNPQMAGGEHVLAALQAAGSR